MGTDKAKKGGNKDGTKGKPSGAGHRSGKFVAMFARTSERKLRNVLKQNGAKAARAYAEEKGFLSLLRKIEKEDTFAGAVAEEALEG